MNIKTEVSKENKINQDYFECTEFTKYSFIKRIYVLPATYNYNRKKKTELPQIISHL